MKNEPFVSRDYGLAAYLFTAAIEPSEIEMRGSDVHFIYDASPALLKAVSAYGENTPVPCRNYFNALRRAKTHVTETIRGARRYEKPRF